MTEYAMIVPPEPPIGHRVEDNYRFIWERTEDGWMLTTDSETMEDWDRLVRQWGPLVDAP